MGDPRKLRKKYSTPSHPWQKERIDEEKILMKEYGFKNKVELWKISSKLLKYKQRVKDLIPKKDEVSEKEKKDLVAKMFKYNLVKENGITEDILGITLKDFCERRLQTVLFKKGFARSIKQARQLIVHEHIFVGENKITSPSYIMTSGEEASLRFSDNSIMKSEDHSERLPVQKKLNEEMAAAGLKPHEEKPIKVAEKPKRKKSAKQEMKEEIKEEKAEEKIEEELEE